MQQSETAWHRAAAAYLTSQNLFVFGSSTVFYAILWHIALVTSSGAWMTYVSLATTLPALLISLFAGVWADRYSRKWLIIGAAGAVTVLTLGLAVVFTTHQNDLVLLLAIGVVRSLGNGIENPAANALLPQIVPSSALTRMNGLNQVVMAAMLLLSPLLAGWILADLGIIWIFIVDAASALLAVLALLTLRVSRPQDETASSAAASAGRTDQQPTAASATQPANQAAGTNAQRRPRAIGQILGGLRYVASQQHLLIFMVLTGLAFILIAPSSQLSTLYVNRQFGAQVWHLTFNEWAWTLGASIAGFAIAWRKQFRDKIRIIALGFAASGLCFAEMGVPQPFLLYLVFMFLSGVAYPFFLTMQTIYLQETIAKDMMGRVFSLWQILSTGIYPIAMLAYGPLADVVPIGGIFVVTGLLLVVVAWLFGRLLAER
ncbi:MFS transporter [Schleiferilactobacillus shenzhenensis]|uniref:Major facilitator superfamily (MFS) profile domain-containing protein n=1 Tax=Schleiferilactobacillus shenzhenensis LY-73 TaxID=1231336 RepID=U4TLM9_9LACO|nr:MFS transporter [Schleiferilactobacillus shenzhenensis]ERL65776.1 hypothetical protein L248_1852 [Schleiferilactobacillus shenzhenensis LY-73]